MSPIKHSNFNHNILMMSAFFLISYVIADIFFDSVASEANKDLTIYLQSNEKFIHFFDLFSILGGGFFYFGVLFLIFFFSTDKLSIVIFFCFHCSNNYLNSVLKIIYASSRPFMEQELIQAFSCEMSMGRPSGHSQSSILFYVFLASYFGHIVKIKFPTKKGKYVKIIIEIFSALIILLTGFSRVYLGVHSFNQVFLGWNYGQFATFLYFVTRDLINKNIRKITEYNSEERKTRNKQILYTILYVLSFLSVTLLIFSLRKKFTKIPNIWYDRVFKKCIMSKNASLFLDETVITTSYGVIVLGINLGLVLSKDTINTEIFGKSLNQLKWWKRVIRLIILALLVLIFGGLPLIIKSSDEKNIFIILLLKNYLPFFLFGVGLIYLIPILYKILRVDINSDLRKCERKNTEEKESNKIGFA